MKIKNVQKMVMCSLFTALIIVGAFIKIPVPVVPFTLQLLFTTMAGLLLGPKWGTLSALLYMVLGLIGVPVFTQGGGLGYVFVPSFGYIIGFVFGTWTTGKIAWAKEKVTIKRLILANFAGLLIVYAFGMAYYYFIGNYVIGSPIGVKALFIYCFFAVVPGDAVCAVLAAFLGNRLIPIIRRMER